MPQNKKFSVVIPYCDRIRVINLVNELLRQNIIHAEIIILINNTKHASDLHFISNNTIQLINPNPPLGINDSWALGAILSGDVGFVSVLNDDIDIGNNFFYRILDIFENCPDAGAVCPWTQTPRTKPESIPIEHKVIKMKHVEGWAFTIRKEILMDALPFPPGMVHFAGDNWLWWFTYRKHKKFWYKDLGNKIFHHVGASQTRETRIRLRKDKQICSKHLRRIFPK